MSHSDDVSAVHQRLSQIFCFVATDDKGQEHLASFMDSEYGWMPMVAANSQIVDELQKIGQQIADETGTPLRVIKFVLREECGLIQPRSSDEEA